MEEWNCKLVLLGNSRSGKTSLVQRFIQDQYLELYTPTGFEKYAVTYEMAEIRIHFHLWDTSGAQAYDTVRPLAYQDSKVFLLCFQIGDPDSLDDTLNKWHPEIRQQCTNVPIILCGCQSDLRSDTDTICDLAKLKKSPVTSEQALAISRRIGALTYVETSAKMGARTVRDAFEVAALAAFGKLNKNHVMPSMQRHRSFLKLRCRSKMDLKDPKTRNCAIM